MTTKDQEEPLLPGDIIQYTNPMFVAGNKQGRRIAQVVAIFPTRTDFCLDLDNGELLPSDTRIKRIQEYVPKDQKLYAHAGIYRSLEQFRLIEGKLDTNKVTGMARQIQQIKSILAGGKRDMDNKVRQIYQACSGKDGDSDSAEDSSDCQFLSDKKTKPGAELNNSSESDLDPPFENDAAPPSKATKASLKPAEKVDDTSSSSDDDKLLLAVMPKTHTLTSTETHLGIVQAH